MGIVYRARHIGSERAVALKTVKVPSPRWLESIRREVLALTRIQHPGIVKIVDHGVHQGRPWYAMDLLEGESLRHFGDRIWSPYRAPFAQFGDGPVSATDRLSEDSSLNVREVPPSHRSSLPGEIVPAAAGELRAVLHVMRRVCATLAFMHGEGFINCDLKPENILLVGGSPVLIDFGLTAHHPGGSGREALEPHLSMSGTMPYMSPEQIRGEFVDARSDLYAAGCLLYELVVGGPPFSGPPRSILQQHLFSFPVPPSQLVFGVPEGLERLILRLLSKDLGDRFGFADEVAATIAELSGDVHRLPDFPPTREYLYRPTFVGREAMVSVLASARDQAANGYGAFVIIGGESGVGKTRLAMEITRIAPGTRMQVVTSEASPLSNENAAAVGAPPLNALRPLLRAVADRCQEGGPDVTERLLGSRRSVLASYEPLLVQVPSYEPIAAPIDLTVEASRQRLFKYLAETLQAFAIDHPVLWVLDDLGWADELSLAFLLSLTADDLANVPLLILCTYRSEETSPVEAIAKLPHVTHYSLPRLGPDHVRSMVGDMLARGAAQVNFVEFIAAQAEGNPFFVAEYLRMAVNERYLRRDRQHSWHLHDAVGAAAPGYHALSLPRSIQELLEFRLRKLSPAAQEVAHAAAVLGRESPADVLREVSPLSDDAYAGALDELLRRSILEPSDAGSFRFAHDKIRTVTYLRIPRAASCRMHESAALSLERHALTGAEPSRFWASLGHHFAAANRPDSAARYLQLAADHARVTHAHIDAIRLYREAIGHVNQTLLSLASDSTSRVVTLLQLHESLGDLLARTGQRDAAREAYDRALHHLQGSRGAQRARICRKIGKTWETQHDHDKALRFYGMAGEGLPPDPMLWAQDERDEWIQIQIDRLWAYYFTDRVPEMDALVNRLRPVVEVHATPLQRARFLRTQWMRNLRRDRYVTTEETLHIARAALAAGKESADADQLLADYFGLGLVLLFNGQPIEAMQAMSDALSMAELGGETSRQARCLAYLSLAARTRGLLAETEAYAVRCHDVASAAGMRDYVAAARANRAWIALRTGNHEDAKVLAREALDLWASLTLVFPLQWLALLPLMEASARTGDPVTAVGCVAPLLAPSQQRLPGDAADALARAAALWTGANPSAAIPAVELALSYLAHTEYH
jgi:serine/threonine protein kinase/tetratricopeptide (TPR) repeat protein